MWGLCLYNRLNRNVRSKFDGDGEFNASEDGWVGGLFARFWGRATMPQQQLGIRQYV